MTPLRTLTLALAAALASGCTMIPQYQRPAAPVAAGFPNAVPAAAEATPADAIVWRDYFADNRCARRSRWRSPTTATCASPRSTSRKRGRSTASSLPTCFLLSAPVAA